MDLPLALTQRLQNGRAVLFIGAGAGFAMERPDGSTMPTAAELAEIIDANLALNTGLTDLASVAELAVIRRGGRADLTREVQSALAGFEPRPELVALTKMRWDAIFTTNYDRGIVRAYELNPGAPQTPRIITAARDLSGFNRYLDVPIFFLHGAVFGEAPEAITITRDDYSRWQGVRKMLFANLRTHLADSTFVYVGYRNTDPNWESIQAEVRAEFLSTPLPQAYRVVPETSAIEREILESRGIITLTGTLSDFSKAIAQLEIPNSGITSLADVPIPPSLAKAFGDSAASTVRLLNSWEICNDADFAQPANSLSFLRGDRPNWGLIERGIAIHRDIEDELYDAVLDYVTATKPQRAVFPVLAPAGYGITTLLMQLGHRLVKDNVQYVFRLKPGAEVLEGDVLFAAERFKEHRPVFIIDDGAARKTPLRNVLPTLNVGGLSAAFLIGARLNEWRSSPGRISSPEFLLESLSENEIPLLIKLLQDTGQLGKLRDLDEDMRFAVIKGINNKQLLVTLREATEGKAFDAIIEDEYRNVGSALARRLYAFVCGIHQGGQYVREDLAASVLNMDTTSLFNETNTALDGVVIHETIDAANGVYGLRSRHRTIARIVWDKLLGEERETLLLEAIRNLNLLYPADRSAFDGLIQMDELIDSMPSLEARVSFFESATTSDPDNPYVRQHFARMFLRTNKPASALAQIDNALVKAGHIRVFHHTRGLALMQLTIDAASVDVGRKYLAQAEAEFLWCIRDEPRDEYAYQSLAELYRKWAERIHESEEAATYFRKAEELIFNGLRNTRVHDHLHVESSRIEEALGNRPAQLAALQRAIQSDAASPVARYLLGRALRRSGDYNKAIEVLKPILLEEPEAFRSAIELALCYAITTGDFAKGAATLSVALLSGKTDARFIAMLGGMQFLARKGDEANKTFALGKQLPIEERRNAIYRPGSQIGNFPFQRVTFEGVVVKVGAGFVFARVADFGSVHVGTSHIDRKRISVGDRLQFAVNFNAIGATADLATLKALNS